jgi:hypothetical protein
MSQILNLRIEMGDKAIHLSMLDYRGDSFLEELRRLKDDQIEELKRIYDIADAFLLVLDPNLDLAPFDRADPESREATFSRHQAHLDAISDAWAERNGMTAKGPRRNVDIGIVLTKSDTPPRLKSVKEARAYCKRQSGTLIEKLKARSNCVAFFAVSAVGDTESIQRSGETTLVPAKELTPTGYEPLLQWIVRRHRWRKNRPYRLLAAALAAMMVLLLVVGGSWWWYRRARVKQVLGDLGRPLIERIELTKTVSSISEDLAQQRSELLQKEIESLGNRISRVMSDQEIKDLRAQVTRLEKSDPGSLRLNVEELRRRLESKAEELLFSQVKAAKESRVANFLTLARRYIDSFPGGPHRMKVDEWMGEAIIAELKRDRDHIRQKTVDDPASLADKAKAILAYADARHPDDPAEIPRMRRAAELALQFCQPNDYHVFLKRTGGFLGTRHHKVQLFNGNNIIIDIWSIQQATVVHWDQVPGARVMIQWKAGETLSARLIGAHFIRGGSEVGWMADAGPLALRLLGVKQSLNIKDAWKSYVEDPFIECEVEGINPDDWKALSDYILPGNRW